MNNEKLHEILKNPQGFTCEERLNAARLAINTLDMIALKNGEIPQPEKTQDKCDHDFGIRYGIFAGNQFRCCQKCGADYYE